ncbi:MAG: beta strand repeat-containing protein, partial [Arenicella sp.]
MVEQIKLCKAGFTKFITEKSWIKAVFKRAVNSKKKSLPIKSFCFATLFLISTSIAQAATTVAPAAPTWGFDSVTGTLLTPGVSVNTMGTLLVPRPGDGDHTLKLFDVRSATLSAARPVQSPDTHLHHNWDVGSIGNVFGLTIDNDRNIYTTASTHFGSYYGFEIGNEANILFGSIGAGAVPDTAALDNNPGTLNDLNAAGAIYKIDATSGNVTLFATLPQTATVYNHEACEGGPSIARNTGPSLGNIAYDKVRDQLYISNFQDGRIYLFDASATVPAGGFDETDALSVFDPAGFEGLTSPDQASPYGLAVSPDGTQLYYGTHEINKNPQLFSVNLDANGAFVGSEIDQSAQLVTDLQYTQDLGGVFSSDNANSHAWVAYSDLHFSPAGELIIGLRTGCNNNFATSHNHGGVYYMLKQDAGGLYNTPADKVPGTGTTYVGNPDTTTAFTNASPAEAATRAGGGRYDAGAISIYSGKTGVGAVDSGPDDGYGGIAIYDKGDGTYDYLITSSDMTVEQGPHGFMLFPHNFTLDTSATPGTNLINPLASFPSLPSSTTAAGVDYKGVGGDIEVLSVLVDWGDAPDTYSTDLITGNATGGADVKGPTHIITADGIILGATVDHEFNGVPSVGADGDDNASAPDDEDGISGFPTLVTTATTYTIPIANISAANASAGAVTIHAWIDFDGNGSFDPDEYTTTTVASGATAPATALTWSGAGVSGQTAGTTYARFRITNDPGIGAATPGGPAINGEVEDYSLQIIELVSLGSTIWEDSDADGTQDAAEPAIVGATVTLLNADGTVYDSDSGTAGIQALTDVTDADGQYNFDGLTPNDYRVQVDLSTVTGGDNYIPTPTQVADPDAAGPGQDNNTDSNVDTAFDPNVNDLIHTSGVVTLTAGGEPTGETDPIGAGGADQPNQGLTATDDPDNSGNMTVDMGFIKPVSLGSTAWLDSDEDGVQDAGEPGIVGATVTLLNADGTVFDSDPNTAGVQALTDTTDADGQYNFNDIPAGDYRVQIDLATATNTGSATFIPSPMQVADPDAAGPGQDNNTDSNIDEPFDPNTADQIHTSGVITLSVGGEPTGETDPIGAGGPDQPNQGLTAANQPDADGNMTVDFGFIQPVSLGSLVWLDSDADGVQDSAEPAIVGATVTLLNANGTVFDNDPNTAGVQSLTDVTDASGLYNFNGLPEGDYRVQVDLNTATSHTGSYLAATPTQVADPDAAGPGQDNNTDSNVDDGAPGHNPAGNIYQSGVVTLSIGGEPSGEIDAIIGGPDQPNQTAAQPDNSGNMTVDFGFIQPVSLGSTIWQDNDADSTQDAAEPAIVGATVTLLNADGTVFDSDPNTAGVQALTDITDGDGQYNFNDLPPGDYRVQVDLSTVVNGSDLLPSPIQVADPDAAGPGQDNNTDSNVDLAFDVNTADLIHTSGVVTLTSGGEPTSESDPIGAGGPDQPNQTLTATDDPDNAGNMTVDMAFVKPVSIGSTVWKDNDFDGVQDAAEPGIVGATVTLLNADGTTYDSNPYVAGVQALTDTTDADGQYNFDGLIPGDYRVQVDLATATNTNAGAFIPTLVQVADPDAAGPGQDNNTDSNIDEPFDPNTADQIHTSGVITLSAGGEPTGETDPIGAGGADQPNQGLTVTNDPDNSGNMTVDFGFIEPVSLGSTVWFDSDSDGTQDAAEPAIVGVTVTLLNADGTVYDSDPVTAGVQSLTDVTDGDGQYNFNDLPEGNYRVQVDLNTATSHAGGALAATPTQVADPDAAGPGQDNNTDSNVDSAAPGHNPAGNIYQSGIVTLSLGGEPTGETDPIGAGGADQPNQTAAQPDANGNMTVDFGFISPVSLGSTIWNDTDADGTQDAAEPAIVGATVTLLNADGTVFDSDPNTAGIQSLTDVTDVDGQYNFDGLPPGDYRVQVDLSTVTGGDDYIVSPVQVADPDAAGPGQDNNTDSNVDTAFDPNVNDLIHTSGVITLTVGG